MPSKVSAIILDYKKARRVIENVRGLLRQKTTDGLEIIVADNSCSAENVSILSPLADLEGVRLIVNAENLGYVRGCNRAAEHATGDYILIVNPDILWPETGTVQALVDYLESNPTVGIVGPKQLDETTGRVSLTARGFPHLRTQILRRSPLRRFPWLRDIVDRDEMVHMDTGKTQPVDWLQSSCIMLRRSLWDSLGGFDERYVMFLADPEICWQAWSRRHSVVYYADTHVSADGLRSSAGGLLDFFRRPTIRQHLRDSLKYRLRHMGRKNPRLGLGGREPMPRPEMPAAPRTLSRP